MNKQQQVLAEKRIALFCGGAVGVVGAVAALLSLSGPWADWRFWLFGFACGAALPVFLAWRFRKTMP